MTRMVYLTLAAVVATGINAASAQPGGQASSNVQSMTGVVKAVSASSLTVESRGKEMTFGVDSSTRVFTKGKTGVRDLVYRFDRERPKLTDLVKPGEQVMVTYRQSRRGMTAVEVRVAQK